MPNRARKQPRDPFSRDDDALPTHSERQQAAALLGRLGGLKGGKARAKSLSAAKRREIARKAAIARWRRG